MTRYKFECRYCHSCIEWENYKDVPPPDVCLDCLPQHEKQIRADTIRAVLAQLAVLCTHVEASYCENGEKMCPHRHECLGCSMYAHVQEMLDRGPKAKALIREYEPWEYDFLAWLRKMSQIDPDDFPDALTALGVAENLIRADERERTLEKVRDWMQEIQYGYGANPQVGDWLLMWDYLCDFLNEKIEEARD